MLWLSRRGVRVLPSLFLLRTLAHFRHHCQLTLHSFASSAYLAGSRFSSFILLVIGSEHALLASLRFQGCGVHLTAVSWVPQPGTWNGMYSHYLKHLRHPTVPQ